ncbi:MAG TPA: glutamine--fructose-6-phosphate transaminase (isomerizing) [Spirochaetia bacterium]|nr:glutamine--fructose-6-phosphate transaminase (isomerizing) [Spirochaetia bacterium]
MCGIVGYVGPKNAVPILMEGLKRLEYRGYDSAGIGCLVRGKLKVVKKEGHLANLEGILPEGLSSTVGIGHTRWATHGGVNDTNAHPQVGVGGKVAVVHNGIIDNYESLRKKLLAQGVEFASETDTEVIAHMVSVFLEAGKEPVEAVRETLRLLQGTYGLVFLFTDHPRLIIGARNGSPLVLGVGEGEMLVASDANAIVRHTSQVVYLDDGEIVTFTPDGFSTSDLRAAVVTKRIETIEWPAEEADKNGYQDYMLKEIFEQPESTARTFGGGGRLVPEFGAAKLGGLNLERRDYFDIKRVSILAMGTAYHAAMIGAHLLETIARVPARAEIACELRSRNPIVEKETLYFAVSQSGETADTLMALREIRNKGGRVLGVVNVVGSTIARESDGGIYVHAGPEMAVASTKAFTSQVMSFVLIALLFARMRDLSLSDGKALVAEIVRVPDLMRQVLAQAEAARRIARKYSSARNFLYLGRGLSHPVALEGALKLKEVAYIFSEGMSAGDVKHGPIALVSEETPVVMIAVKGESLDKTIGGMEEIRARKGRVIAVTNTDDPRIARIAEDVIRVPETREALSPLLTVIPLQLLAYYTAVHLERNVDRPRNLAKSVTVE